MRFNGSGRLNYSTDPYKLVLVVDPDLSRYYRSFVPNHFNVSPQKYPAHISVVRKAIPPNLTVWNKHQNEECQFEYDGIIYNDETYWWIGAQSVELEKIRAELGLPIYSDITKSPDGRHNFHITIGNTKDRK